MSRLANLRARVVALAAFRDAMSELLDEEEEFEPLAEVLMPFTDRLLHCLAKAEDPDGYHPYPHPHGTGWWLKAFDAPRTPAAPRSEP